MKKILVFQHVPFEILGNLDPLFREKGFKIRYVNFSRNPNYTPDITDYEGLVVLGGPMSVNDHAIYPHIVKEIKAIQQAIENNIPILGICLGAQLLARALGAVVRVNSEKEIGWYDLNTTKHAKGDKLFQHFEQTEKIFQWHGDTFEMPKGAVHLAFSSTCENQAFRYQEKIYGLQFHLEVDRFLIDRWLSVPIHQQELADLKGTIDPHAIELDTKNYIQRSSLLARKVFSAFIELFELPEKRKFLSR